MWGSPKGDTDPVRIVGQKNWGQNWGQKDVEECAPADWSKTPKGNTHNPARQKPDASAYGSQQNVTRTTRPLLAQLGSYTHPYTPRIWPTDLGAVALAHVKVRAEYYP